MATSWKFVAGRVRSLRTDEGLSKSRGMSDPAPESAIFQDRRRVRYLKLIALFKITKGVLLLLLGVSLVFLNARTGWMDAVSSWIADEILLKHSSAISYLLHKLQAALAGGMLRATGVLALFYAVLFFTEGIGVYLQRRWAAWLMIFECAGLIPIEVRHLWHHPGLVGALILLANCFIVWFLYRVLRLDKAQLHARHQCKLAEIR
jgi:uncharacterized membrane protein (DUF2068 family)